MATFCPQVLPTQILSSTNPKQDSGLLDNISTCEIFHTKAPFRNLWQSSILKSLASLKHGARTRIRIQVYTLKHIHIRPMNHPQEAVPWPPQRLSGCGAGLVKLRQILSNKSGLPWVSGSVGYSLGFRY